MSTATIAKFCAFVIFSCGLTACGLAVSKTGDAPAAARFGPPVLVARIKSKDLSESSGIAASKCNPDVLWSHNDSGNDETIFAISTRGDLIGEWKVTNAKNIDWEDIAVYKDRAGKCFVYIGDIGDNKLQRSEHVIYRVPEPVITGSPAGDKGKFETTPAEKLVFRYPGEPHDAETLMVEPVSGNIYILTKQLSGPSHVYRLRPEFDRGGAQIAEQVADITVPAIPNGYLTGGDISPDGRRMALCDYTQGYEYTLPAGDPNFDDIWKQDPTVIELGKRTTGEGLGYSSDGSALFATSEGREPPLIRVQRQ